MFEKTAVFRIEEVPLVINIMKRKYVLFGLILFRPPFMETDIGHYTSAIRLNNKWEMFDDSRPKSYTVPNNAKAVIHAIFYIKSDVDDINDVNDVNDINDINDVNDMNDVHDVHVSNNVNDVDDANNVDDVDDVSDAHCNSLESDSVRQSSFDVRATFRSILT